jgi:ribose-phosphate pyrophosphokinase
VSIREFLKKDSNMRDDFLIFCGSASQSLGAHIAQILERSPADCVIERFPNGEVNVHLDEPVRGREVYIVQSTCPPVDANLIELLATADACRRSGAARITAIVPYFGYGRADKRNGQRAPVTGSMIARFIESAGIDHLLTVDLHAPQIEGFFHIPVDSVTGVLALCNSLRKDLPDGTVIISPDEGRVKMATEFARHLRCPLALLHKERRGGSDARVTHVVGEVRQRPCLIIDDLISTGSTIAQAAEALLHAGAQENLRVAATHALLVGNARERLANSGIRQVIVSNSIPPSEHHWPPLAVVSLAPVLAGAVYRLQSGASLADLYEHVIYGGVERILTP